MRSRSRPVTAPASAPVAELVRTANGSHERSCRSSSSGHGPARPRQPEGRDPPSARWAITTTPVAEGGGVDDGRDPDRVVGQPVGDPAAPHPLDVPRHIHPRAYGRTRAGPHPTQAEANGRRLRPWLLPPSFHTPPLEAPHTASCARSSLPSTPAHPPDGEIAARSPTATAPPGAARRLVAPAQRPHRRGPRADDRELSSERRRRRPDTFRASVEESTDDARQHSSAGAARRGRGPGDRLRTRSPGPPASPT